MLIYIFESDEAAIGNNPKEKLVSSFGSDIKFCTVKEIIDITAIDKTAIYVSSLQSLGETKQDIMDSLNYISEKGVRIIIGDVPETMKWNPDITKVVTGLYRLLAYEDYKKRVVKQRQKINEMKQDEEKWKSYGRKQKLTIDEFASIYGAVLRGELSAKQGQQELSISKRTYYKYKEIYEKGYTND